jgi:hypothetical protein
VAGLTDIAVTSAAADSSDVTSSAGRVTDWTLAPPLTDITDPM